MKEGLKSHSKFKIPLSAPAPSHSWSCLLPVMQMRHFLTIISSLKIPVITKEQCDLAIIYAIPEHHHLQSQSKGDLGKEISS